MPIIKAFKGHITVEGNSRENPEETIYSWTLSAYGETLGELMDNLVQTSVVIANDAFKWAVQNKSADYNLLDDRWFISFIHPEIFPREGREGTDVGNGSNLASFDAIVKNSALFREVSINMAVGHLRLAQSGPTNIPEKPAVPFNGIYDVTSFSEMTQFGWTGKELDSIMEIAQEEGRLGGSPVAVREKPKWWNKLRKVAS